MNQRRLSGVVPQKEAAGEKYIPVLKSSSEVEKGLDRDAHRAQAGLWSTERKRCIEGGESIFKFEPTDVASQQQLL